MADKEVKINPHKSNDQGLLHFTEAFKFSNIWNWEYVCSCNVLLASNVLLHKL